MAAEKKATAKKAAKPAEAKATKAVKATKVRRPEAKKSVLGHIGEYFTGAWYELRQVRWPNRRATWSLTLAVIVFSAFFVLLIVLLDMAFKSLFELIIG